MMFALYNNNWKCSKLISLFCYGIAFVAIFFTSYVLALISVNWIDSDSVLVVNMEVEAQYCAIYYGNSVTDTFRGTMFRQTIVSQQICRGDSMDVRLTFTFGPWMRRKLFKLLQIFLANYLFSRQVFSTCIALNSKYRLEVMWIEKVWNLFLDMHDRKLNWSFWNLYLLNFALTPHILEIYVND